MQLLLNEQIMSNIKNALIPFFFLTIHAHTDGTVHMDTTLSPTSSVLILKSFKKIIIYR
jgi:hypothetical protein